MLGTWQFYIILEFSLFAIICPNSFFVVLNFETGGRQDANENESCRFSSGSLCAHYNFNLRALEDTKINALLGLFSH